LAGERYWTLALVPLVTEAKWMPGQFALILASAARWRLPVVFWITNGSGTDKEIRPLFLRAAKMFECLTLVAQTDFNFIYHNNNEPAALPKKQKALAHFLAMTLTVRVYSQRLLDKLGRMSCDPSEQQNCRYISSAVGATSL